MKKLFGLFLSGLLVITAAGCAHGKKEVPPPTYELPLLKGFPSKNYPYNDLGPVQASFSESLTTENDAKIFYEFLAKDLVSAAKAKGANAVINVQYETKAGVHMASGEAVFFTQHIK